MENHYFKCLHCTHNKRLTHKSTNCNQIYCILLLYFSYVVFALRMQNVKRFIRCFTSNRSLYVLFFPFALALTLYTQCYFIFLFSFCFSFSPRSLVSISHSHTSLNFCHGVYICEAKRKKIGWWWWWWWWNCVYSVRCMFVQCVMYTIIPCLYVYLIFRSRLSFQR